MTCEGPNWTTSAQRANWIGRPIKIELRVTRSPYVAQFQPALSAGVPI